MHGWYHAQGAASKARKGQDRTGGSGKPRVREGGREMRRRSGRGGEGREGGGGRGGGGGTGRSFRWPRGLLRPVRICGHMASASAAAASGRGARNLLQFLRLVGQLKVRGRRRGVRGRGGPHGERPVRPRGYETPRSPLGLHRPRRPRGSGEETPVGAVVRPDCRRRKRAAVTERRGC